MALDAHASGPAAAAHIPRSCQRQELGAQGLSALSTATAAWIYSRLCVISLLLLVHLGLGQVNIHPYIIGDTSVARTRRSALVFVRTVSAVVDYFFVFGVS
jgi:hypothetical protein